MTTPDKISSLLYEIVSVDNTARYGGYHRQLFTRSLSILEEALVICTLCQGVKRDACIYQGMSSCRPCSSCPDKSAPVRDTRELVNRLFIKCPLAVRGCNWTGSVTDGERHLQNCKEVLYPCPNKCEAGVSRRTQEQHGRLCSMRVLPCEYCGDEMTAKQLESHLLTCAMHPVSCPNCSQALKRREETEHLRNCPAKLVREQTQTGNEVSVREERVRVPDEMKQSGDYSELERLKERVSCLEKKNQLLTAAIFSRPDLMKYDTTTGRILEGFKWQIAGVARLTSSVSTFRSPSFHIRHHNLVMTAHSGLIGSVAFSVTRVSGCYDDIVQESCLSYFRCDMMAGEDGRPLELSGRIKHTLELDKRSSPFLQIDLCTLTDSLYLREDTLIIHVYFDTTQ